MVALAAASETSGWVVVALHADPSLEEQAGRGVPAQTAALVAALRDVAARCADVRCCQIPALDAIPEDPDRSATEPRQDRSSRSRWQLPRALRFFGRRGYLKVWFSF